MWAQIYTAPSHKCLLPRWVTPPPKFIQSTQHERHLFGAAICVIHVQQTVIIRIRQRFHINGSYPTIVSYHISPSYPLQSTTCEKTSYNECMEIQTARQERARMRHNNLLPWESKSSFKNHGQKVAVRWLSAVAAVSRQIFSSKHQIDPKFTYDNSGTCLAYLSVPDTFPELVSYHGFFLPALRTEALQSCIKDDDWWKKREEVD